MQWRRLLLGCVLLVVLSGLFVHYGATVDEHKPYPDSEELVESYDTHVGETVQISGTVRASSENGTMTVVLRQFESFGTLTVRGADRTAPPGGTVQVIGTLEPDRRIVAEHVLLVNARSWSEAYKYAVSVVGAALVLVVFFREWRVDTEAFAFEVRDDG